MNRWLTIVLALVMALQSLAAIGDTTQPHHPATSHLAHGPDRDHGHDHGHDHEHSARQVAIDPGTAAREESSESSLDQSSDHCPQQNHAHFHMVVVSAATDMAVLSAGQRLPDYQASDTVARPPSLFRPPIA